MIIVYNLSIQFLRLILYIAGFFQDKAKAFVSGRRNIFTILEEKFKNNTQPIIWVHCASLGEFEQGRPVIEALKKSWTQHKILLTFFSSSGYEIQKNYAKADYIFYLPLDTESNARRFISITKPVLAIFVKYEFWNHYTSELNKQGIPLLSISSIFRKDQFFFKPFGSFFRRILSNFTYFFVQNETSVALLHSINIQNCKQAGDTRFDRVNLLAQQRIEIALIERFKGASKTWIVGSCWAEDLKVLAPFINEKKNDLKFIIAPHELSESFISTIENTLAVRSIRFSALAESTEDYTVLIFDNIGMLSKLYRYGEFAFVGGAFGKGLHNILEPACYGIPIFFGDRNYKKFQEANDLIERGSAFAITDYSQLRSNYGMLVSQPENYNNACKASLQYVRENLGATDMIMEYCNKLLQP